MPRQNPFVLAFLPFVIAGCSSAPMSPNLGGPKREATVAESAAVAESCELEKLELDTELVLGLAPAERAELEAALLQGPVAVRAEGCKLVIVGACELRATPAFTAAPKEAPAEIAEEADLRRVAPLFADRWTRAAGEGFPLHLTLASAGRFEYAQATIAPSSVEACKQATHVIKSYGVGAYEVTKKDGGALEKAGDRAACAGASGSSPPAACRELIAVKLVPLGGKKDAETGKERTVDGPTKSASGAPGGAATALDQGKLQRDKLEADDDAAEAGHFGPPHPIVEAAGEGKDGGHGRGGSIEGSAEPRV